LVQGLNQNIICFPFPPHYFDLCGGRWEKYFIFSANKYTDPEVYYYTSGTVNGLHGTIGTVNGTLNGLHGMIETVNGTLNGLHGTV
jgi:hypothetical protein